MNRCSAPPAQVPGFFDTASLGTGGNFAFTVEFSGGVSLQVEQQMQMSSVPPGTAAAIENMDSKLIDPKVANEYAGYGVKP